MTHVSDDDIMLLAETVEEHLVFSKDQLIMMEHLKTCRECYEKFLNFLRDFSLNERSK